MRNYTRRFTIPTTSNTFDSRYIRQFTTWHVAYEEDGKLVFIELQCRPDESPRDYLTELGVDILDAIVEFVD